MVTFVPNLEEKLAKGKDVQQFLGDTAFTIRVRAEELLAEHRDTGDAAIELDHHDVDWYVTLSDDRGQKHALSIEYGRAAGSFEVTDPKTGKTKTISYGAMAGLFILHKAVGIPKKAKGKVKL